MQASTMMVSSSPTPTRCSRDAPPGLTSSRLKGQVILLLHSLDLFQKIESTSYSYEESISFEDGLFKVIDGQGFKVLNETALQDFFTLQGTLEHICSFILHYSLKHGFEDEGIIQQEYHHTFQL